VKNDRQDNVVSNTNILSNHTAPFTIPVWPVLFPENRGVFGREERGKDKDTEREREKERVRKI